MKHNLRELKQNVKDSIQRDFKKVLFGVPPVQNKQGFLEGGTPPDIKRIAKVLN